MNGKLKLITDGQVEPITLEEARLHLRLDTSGSPPSHPDDSLVTVLITVARQSAEAYLGRSLVQQTYELALDRFPNPDDVTEAINLQVWPVRSITSVQYQDEDDASQTVDAADYVFDTLRKTCRDCSYRALAWYEEQGERCQDHFCSRAYGQRQS